VAISLPLADPVIAVALTALTLRITSQSWLAVRGHSHAH